MSRSRIASRSLLVCSSFALCLAAQARKPEGNTDWPACVQARMARGDDLIALRYRRDENGGLEVASTEGGAEPFRPMFPEEFLPHRRPAATLVGAGLLLFAHGDSGWLGATDAERHLRRAGLALEPIALRQLLVAPWPDGGAARTRVELLDRMVAIDWLQRHGHHGVVAELKALASGRDVPAELAARARDAFAAVKHATSVPRRRLDPATMPLPAVADLYVVVDHARFSDLAPLRAFARRLAIDVSYDQLLRLQAPTPDDLYIGQLVADVLDEQPFEAARRFGNHRFDHTVIALRGDTSPTAAGGLGVVLTWSAQIAGAFDVATLTTGLHELAAVVPALQPAKRDGALAVQWPGGEGEAGADVVTAHGPDMAGRPRPALAAELLEPGPAVRVVVPPTSKAWAAALRAGLPPAKRAELQVTCGDELRVAATLAARDEDAADAWAALARTFLADVAADLRAELAREPDHAAWSQPVLDVLAATAITTDGARVDVVLTSQGVGWPTLSAAHRVIGRLGARAYHRGLARFAGLRPR